MEAGGGSNCQIVFHGTGADVRTDGEIIYGEPLPLYSENATDKPVANLLTKKVAERWAQGVSYASEFFVRVEVQEIWRKVPLSVPLKCNVILQNGIPANHRPLWKPNDYSSVDALVWMREVTDVLHDTGGLHRVNTAYIGMSKQFRRHKRNALRNGNGGAAMSEPDWDVDGFEEAHFDDARPLAFLLNAAPEHLTVCGLADDAPSAPAFFQMRPRVETLQNFKAMLLKIASVSINPYIDYTVRELLKLVHPASISGRPRKAKPPDLTPLLPASPSNSQASSDPFDGLIRAAML